MTPASRNAVNGTVLYMKSTLPLIQSVLVLAYATISFLAWLDRLKGIVTVWLFGISLTIFGAIGPASSPVHGLEPVAAVAAGSAVLQSCKQEIERFCTDPSGSQAQAGRNAAICLRPFRTSLSLRCRAAVTAASGGGQ